MIRSVRDIVDAEMEGRTSNYAWLKTPSQVTIAGTWFDLSMSPGNPGPKYWFDATPLSSQQASKSNDGGLNHGLNVGPLTKVLRMTNNFTPTATALPMPMIMSDYLVYYPSCDDSIVEPQTMTNNYYVFSVATFSLTRSVITLTKKGLYNLTNVRFTNAGGVLPNGITADTDYYVIKNSDTTFQLATTYSNAVAKINITFSNTGTGVHSMNTILPRYTNGDGLQVMAVTLAQRTGGQSFYFTYTNSEGVTGRTSQTVIQNTSAAVGTVTTSATVNAQVTGAFIGLQSGDKGIRSIQSVTMLGSDTGLFALILVKPIVTDQIQNITAPNEVDYFIEKGLVPVIEDDAFLNYVCYVRGSLAASVLQGYIKTVWN